MNPDQQLDAEEIVIPRRFRGPPNSANGGYSCGLIGCRVHGPARVRLTEPPPLDALMAIRTLDERSAELILEGRAIGRAHAVSEQWEVPEPVAFDVASVASKRFPWYEGHPFPSCFVCGPERLETDGLRILPGEVPDRDIVAAPWIPAESVCDASGAVQPEIVWAALDCPSWFGILAFGRDAQYALLGELAVHVLERPREGERCVVTGWSRGREGRKLYGGTAIHGDTGRLLASSAATWIELRSAHTLQ